MKKIILSLFPCLLIGAVLFTSCNLKKSTSEVSADTVAVITDSLSIVINPEAIDSMLFVPNDGQPFRMDMADCKPLAEYLKEAVYDTALNESGIMIKMQAPDYTVVLYYTDKTAEESDWLMIWKESGRTKLANIWYTLPESNRNSVYELFEKHKNE